MQKRKFTRVVGKGFTDLFHYSYKMTLALFLLLNFNHTYAAENVLESAEEIVEELVEGIKSEDGRWFDVEVIIFERTKNTNVREEFKQSATNKRPNVYWELQEAKLQPNITPLLSNLPHCHKNIDPFEESKNRLENGFNELTPAEFYNRYIQYQKLISSEWRLSDTLCVMPSEQLSAYWQLIENINFLPVNNGQYFTQVKWQKMPKTLTGFDYDDYRDVYLLDPQNLKLASQAKQIDAHWGTKTLLHMGWRQPGLKPKNAIPVYLRAGINYSDSFYYDGHAQQSIIEPEKTVGEIPATETYQTESSEQILMADVRSNVDLFLEKLRSGAVIDPKKQILVTPKRKNLPIETWQLDGTIKVHLDHYLYFDADFNFRQKQQLEVDIDKILAKEQSNSKQVLQNNLTNDSQNVLISAANKDKAVSEFNEFNGSSESPVGDDSLLEIEYLQNFPFKQLRRTYSGDLHYLDHPKFGVLFQIRKYRH